MFHKYPYTNFHDMNQDWLLNAVKEVQTEVENFVAFNKVTFRGVWDGSPYPAWTVIDDGLGNGYLSLQAVPANVPLTDTDYWTPVASYSTIYSAFNSRITALETGTINGMALSSMPFAIAANAVPYDGTLSGLVSTRVQSAIDELASILSTVTAVSTSTWTDNGITYIVAKYGRIVEFSTVTGALAADVPANTQIALIPSGYRPAYMVTHLREADANIRITVNTDGTVRSTSALTTGTFLRFTATFIA